MRLLASNIMGYEGAINYRMTWMTQTYEENI
jgi:hypothetical protein